MISKYIVWILVIGNVALAVTADTVSTLWAKGEKVNTLWFWLILLLGPAVFLSFGQIAHRTGLAVASSVANTLLVLTSMSVGLIFFNEWRNITTIQYVGMGLAIAGIILMLFFPKH